MEGIAGHIKRFWDPRMRLGILKWMDEHGGEGMRPLVAEAIERYRSTLMPQSA